jgi:hypothetical protein
VVLRLCPDPTGLLFPQITLAPISRQLLHFLRSIGVSSYAAGAMQC